MVHNKIVRFNQNCINHKTRKANLPKIPFGEFGTEARNSNSTFLEISKSTTKFATTQFLSLFLFGFVVR